MVCIWLIYDKNQVYNNGNSDSANWFGVIGSMGKFVLAVHGEVFK
ncbi:hypothetical protein V7417_05520 [Bacillus pumilus]